MREVEGTFKNILDVYIFIYMFLCDIDIYVFFSY